MPEDARKCLTLAERLNWRSSVSTSVQLGASADSIPRRTCARHARTHTPQRFFLMSLRSGIPSIAELDSLERDAFYGDITDFSRTFLQTHGQAMKGYGRLWGQDPFKLWSRRWEYPYAAQTTIEFGEQQQQQQHPGDRPFRVLDAGSGVTFFPYYVCSKRPNAEVTCVDSNPSYPPMFEAINRTVGGAPRVRFVEAMLQKLPLEGASLDAICCISVLEHTSNYGEIVREFARCLRGGGLLVLTFDLSLDGKFELDRPTAAKLLHAVAEYFAPRGVPADQGTAPWEAELGRTDDPAQRDVILSTDHVRRTRPELLPWRYPMAKAVHDLIKGHGWTGGFRSKSVFCLEATKR
jgi:SAM-dependent methyltransferase